MAWSAKKSIVGGFFASTIVSNICAVCIALLCRQSKARTISGLACVQGASMHNPAEPEEKVFECRYIGGAQDSAESTGCLLQREELEEALLTSTRNDALIGRSVKKSFSGVTHYGRIYCSRDSGSPGNEKWWTVSKHNLFHL